jgi:hypothetical protein
MSLCILLSGVTCLVVAAIVSRQRVPLLVALAMIISGYSG